MQKNAVAALVYLRIFPVKNEFKSCSYTSHKFYWEILKLVIT